MCQECFSRYIQFEVVLGNQVQFWQECWCGDQTLREDFPILFEIAIDREASTEFNLVRQQGGERSWDVSLLRDLNDWGMELVGPSFIQSHIPSIEGGDRVRWKLKKIVEFHIWSFYSVLRGHSIVTFPWKGIGGVKVSWRVSFF